MKNHAKFCASLAAVFFAAVCIAPGAQAFTVQNSDTPAGSGQGYLELEKPAANPKAPISQFSTENGQTTYKSGNSTFQFGSQPSFNQRYNTDNIFNPYARDGR